MVPHQDTIPATHEAKAGVPGGENQDAEAGQPHDRFPGDGDEPTGPASSKGQDPQRHQLGVATQLCPQGRVHFRGPAGVTVVYEREGHAVEIAESVVERVVAVIHAGLAVYALVPFS